VQHPQEGSLYTVIVMGFDSPALTDGRSASSTAPLNVVVAARAIHARRVICVSSMAERPL